MAWPLSPLSPLLELPPIRRSTGSVATPRPVGGAVTRAETVAAASSPSRVVILPTVDRARMAELPSFEAAYVALGGRPEHAETARRRLFSSSVTCSMPYPTPHPTGGAHPIGDLFGASPAAGFPPAIIDAAGATRAVTWRPGGAAGSPPIDLAAYRPGSDRYLTADDYRNLLLDAVERRIDPRPGVGPLADFRPRTETQLVLECQAPPEVLISPSTAMFTRVFLVMPRHLGVGQMGALVAIGPSLRWYSRPLERSSPASSIGWLTAVFVGLATIVISIVTLGAGTALVAAGAAIGGIAAVAALGAVALVNFAGEKMLEVVEGIGEREDVSDEDKRVVRNWTRSFLALATSDAAAGRVIPRED